MSPMFQTMLESRDRGLYYPHLYVPKYTLDHPASPRWLSVPPDVHQVHALACFRLCSWREIGVERESHIGNTRYTEVAPMDYIVCVETLALVSLCAKERMILAGGRLALCLTNQCV